MSKSLLPDNPAPISVAMIARNEADNLPRCLDSVCGWVAEIVIVINDCTDDTAGIAESYGARVIEHPWTNFRDQKNLSLEHCTQPWILALDADEAVSPELKDELLAFIRSPQAEEFAAAEFPRKVWLMGRWINHGDWYPDYSLRLFRRGMARWAGATVHEKVHWEGSCKRLKSDLYHYTYRDIADHLQRIQRYATLFGERQLEVGKRFSPLATVVRPLWRFFRCYVLKGGFRDGFHGFYVAVMTAVYTFLRYASLWEAQWKRSGKTEPFSNQVYP